MPVDMLTINTKPIDGQQPASVTGLVKKTAEAEMGNYLPNYVQATFDACGKKLPGSTLVVGGDGRYFNKIACQVITKMAAANGVGRVLLAKDGILSAAAASAVISKRKALGGFILTAGFAPGGPDAEWGIKFSSANGGPADDTLNAAIHTNTQNIAQYKIAAHVTWPAVDLSKEGKIKVDSFTVSRPRSTWDGGGGPAVSA